MLCVIKIVVSLHRSKQSWCRSSVWLECLPVTQEVDGSSPFGTAKKETSNTMPLFLFYQIQICSNQFYFYQKLITFEGFVVELA